MKKNTKQKGIALITTIILSSLMLTTLFTVSREMISEARNAGLIENSLVAYYAAEAGLEEALLEYKYNPDSTISERCKRVFPDEQSDQAMANSALCGKVFKDRYFLVNSYFGNEDVVDSTIYRDNVYEVSLAENDNFEIQWQDINTVATSWVSVEFTTIGENGAISDKRIVNPNKGESRAFQSSGSGNRIVRIRPWYLRESTPTSYIEGVPNSDPKKVPGIKVTALQGNFLNRSIVNIESTGFYGGVARKITAKVDRSSGNIINVFDFVIYSKGDLTK